MFAGKFPRRYIEVCISTQILDLIDEGRVLQSYPISTAKNGVGQLMGSECTPLGWHKVRAKIGADQPINSVFIGRRATGEVYTHALAEQYPKRDWILSRILWLGGLEPRFNRYADVDSTWRYIYIHGCPDHLLQGKPESHGCIRMKNSDVIDLFQQVQAGEIVFISYS
ncbi:MAG: L,D-transpeptidase family protein [Methyloprofundus sp.]|nr:L,D-transpeptidase family protein [Methyloprofundus sp.]